MLLLLLVAWCFLLGGGGAAAAVEVALAAVKSCLYAPILAGFGCKHTFYIVLFCFRSFSASCLFPAFFSCHFFAVCCINPFDYVRTAKNMRTFVPERFSLKFGCSFCEGFGRGQVSVDEIVQASGVGWGLVASVCLRLLCAGGGGVLKNKERLALACSLASRIVSCFFFSSACLRCVA